MAPPKISTQGRGPRLIIESLGLRALEQANQEIIGPVLAATMGWRDWQHPLGVFVLDEPYLMRRPAKVPFWASIIVPVVLGFLWPFWGILLAPPLLAVA